MMLLLLLERDFLPIVVGGILLYFLIKALKNWNKRRKQENKEAWRKQVTNALSPTEVLKLPPADLTKLKERIERFNKSLRENINGSVRTVTFQYNLKNDDYRQLVEIQRTFQDAGWEVTLKYPFLIDKNIVDMTFTLPHDIEMPRQFEYENKPAEETGVRAEATNTAEADAILKNLDKEFQELEERMSKPTKT